MLLFPRFRIYQTKLLCKQIATKMPHRNILKLYTTSIGTLSLPFYTLPPCPSAGFQNAPAVDRVDSPQHPSKKAIKECRLAYLLILVHSMEALAKKA